MTGRRAPPTSVGKFIDAGAIAHLLGQHSSTLGWLFAIVLMDASIIGAAAVTLATSYAFGDVFGLKHSLHRGFSDAKQFYFSYTAMVVLAAVIVLIPGAPLGLITTAVQALAGLLLPSASVFLLLLCNDREVLGPWVNRKWLNWVAVLIVGTLLLLSGILMATTMFPHLNVVAVAGYLALAMVVLGAAAGPVLRWLARRQPAAPIAPTPVREVDRNSWRMPPLALLQPVTWSAGTRLGMIALRAYLVVGALLLVVKAVQISAGLIAGARECFVEIHADGAGSGLLPVAVPIEHRDRILPRLRQRILTGGAQMRRAAVRALAVGLFVPRPVPAAEQQWDITRFRVEVAHAPIARAQTVGLDG